VANCGTLINKSTSNKTGIFMNLFNANVIVTLAKQEQPCGGFTIARAMEDNRKSPALGEFRM
jgi:hypothetical protein